MAEQEGFEPSDAVASTVFKTVPLSHSGIAPFDLVKSDSAIVNVTGSIYCYTSL